jgi:DNA recombination protein RmuC
MAADSVLSSDAGGTVAVVLAAALLGAAVAALALRARGARAAREAAHDTLVRIEQRLDAAAHATQDEGERLVATLHAQERLRHEDHARLLQTLERRLAETTSEQARAAGELRTALGEDAASLERALVGALAAGNSRTAHSVGALQARFEQRQGETATGLHQGLQRGLQGLSRQVAEALGRGSEALERRVEALTRATDQRLEAISLQVEQRLAEGFEKTTATFQDVLARLALIDEAQKRLTELSGNVLSLQELLADKRSRGAFGEVQLNALVANVLPTSAYALQHTLSNGRRADCVLFLPQPTGTVAIDAKFPLESFQRMTDTAAGEPARERAARRFRADVHKHVRDIAARYILPGETTDGAIMFLPAEAVFAEIQAHHPEVVQTAWRARVWLASPTTLMAILNTARGVLKDDATRRQVHVIRGHLSELARDFERFRSRMDKLASHIDQANRDVQQVHTSARRISRRFDAIEQVEVEDGDAPPRDAGGAPDALGYRARD